MSLDQAKWIWVDKAPEINDFAEFCDSFVYGGGKVILRLCAETDYVVHLNGKRILYCQFANYENEKYYDEEDITDLCVEGENRILFTVRHEGVNTACHVSCGAGLIYSIDTDDVCLAYSGEKTTGRRSPSYVSGLPRSVTPQLGLSVDMTAVGEQLPYTPCKEVKLSRNLVKRPVKRFINCPPVEGKHLDVDGRRIYDLGREEAGYVYLRVRCKAPSRVMLTFGEHLKNGYVERIIGARDFSMNFDCAEGENYFENCFLRVGGRYLELYCDDSTEVLEIGIIPVLYPLTEIPCTLSGLDRQIYDVSVRTLRLCMHTHYEDCPWREQALYVLDSRNQMLCGYYAFKETEFQCENLIFMSKGKRSDGMLELTYPAINTPAIPFFSAMYPVAVWEYVEHTKDATIIPVVMNTMLGIMNRLYSWVDGSGLIKNQGKPYWNFYEWSHGSNGHGDFGLEGAYDLMINCAFVYSCERLAKLCDAVGIEMPDYHTDEMKASIVRAFYNETTGIFRSSTVNGVESVLGNTFAILIGLGDHRTYRAIRGEVAELVPITLSMKGYLYDAILSCEEGDGKEFVLADIRKNYSSMLDLGATSFWETLSSYDEAEDGWSLCHGWSAIPIYYFNRLL